MSHIWHKDRLYVSRCGCVLKFLNDSMYTHQSTYAVLRVAHQSACSECLDLNGPDNGPASWTYDGDKKWDGSQRDEGFHLHIVREIRP